MRATEIIRDVLDLIDSIDNNTDDTVSQSEPVAVIAGAEIDSGNELDDNVRRFKQIIDLVSGQQNPAEFANSPEEKIADIDSVTVDAGGGLNSPKHPADIRGEHPSMFPFFQAISKD
jgi:hypothetical protein